MISRAELAQRLESHYHLCNRADLISPDPLECVYRYDASEDREIVGLVSAGLAYGRVKQILDNLNKLLAVLGPSPRAYLMETSGMQLGRDVRGFRHRWTTDVEVGALLEGMKKMLEHHGSLENGMAAQLPGDSIDVAPALAGFVDELLMNRDSNSLLPHPGKGSACKRLHMYLRWMVRKDNVDPGCWRCLDARQLMIPLDTHMFYVGRKFRMTRRKQPDLKAAQEITAAFRRMVPHDPVRYDFALTRLGIRGDMSMPDFIAALQQPASRER